MTASLISTFLHKEWLDYTKLMAMKVTVSQKKYCWDMLLERHEKAIEECELSLGKTPDGYDRHTTETGQVWFQTITIKWVAMILLVEGLAFYSLKTNKTKKHNTCEA